MYSGFEFQITRDAQVGSAAEKWPVPLQGGSIGRSPDCTWVLKDPNRVVSRLHAHVLVENSRCHWKDMGTNSTLVNGKPMPQNQSVPLSLGDVLRIGDYTMTLAKATGNWDVLDELLPRPEVDVLESWVAPQKPGINIDDLLADLDLPSPAAQNYPDANVPVLAQRMYVGNQQAESVVSPVQSDQVAANPCSLEGEKLKHLLGICVHGCMQLLAARRIFKEEMGGKLTSISGNGNNPLKFSVSSAEAMNKLLGENSPAYLNAEQAFEQAFQDLQQHMQLSVARIQNLIEQIQEGLDPAVIEQEVNKQGGLSLSLEVARKARLWDLYCERYQQLVATWS
jgi:type VI secretion system protein ImpI